MFVILSFFISGFTTYSGYTTYNSGYVGDSQYEYEFLHSNWEYYINNTTSYIYYTYQPLRNIYFVLISDRTFVIPGEYFSIYLEDPRFIGVGLYDFILKSYNVLPHSDTFSVYYYRVFYYWDYYRMNRWYSWNRRALYNRYRVIRPSHYKKPRILQRYVPKVRDGVKSRIYKKDTKYNFYNKTDKVPRSSNNYIKNRNYDRGRSTIKRSSYRTSSGQHKNFNRSNNSNSNGGIKRKK